MTNNVSIIQTLIIQNDTDQLKSDMGFLSPEFNWMSWALSCLQLRKFYDKVELYTNKQGKKILIDTLNLPYTKVHIIPDEDVGFPKGLWAYAKIHTYSLQKGPFIHVDGDVFIWEKLKELQGIKHLIVQNFESTDYYYRHIYKVLIDAGFTFPDSIQEVLNNNEPLNSINAGIIGGTDLIFFANYQRIAQKFIIDNTDKLSLINKEKFNVIFEQHLFGCLARQQRIPVITQLTEVIDDMKYPELANFPGLPKQSSYLHIVGAYKKSIDIGIFLAKQLRQNYPEYYYTIIKKCSEAGIDLFFNCYSDKANYSNLSGDFIYDNTIQINWKELYETEKQQQGKLEQTFANEALLHDIFFQTNSLVSTLSKKEKEGNKITYCKIPCSLLLAFKEMQCDELDEFILQFLATPQKFNTLYNELKKMFNEDELKEGDDLLIQLISLKLKNGCISNLYYIN